ncbi:MAG: hypothetical protein ABIG95_02375 [Candidatus Woesearchaeota archaeon]
MRIIGLHEVWRSPYTHWLRSLNLKLEDGALEGEPLTDLCARLLSGYSGVRVGSNTEHRVVLAALIPAPKSGCMDRLVMAERWGKLPPEEIIKICYEWGGFRPEEDLAEMYRVWGGLSQQALVGMSKVVAMCPERLVEVLEQYCSSHEEDLQQVRYNAPIVISLLVRAERKRITAMLGSSGACGLQLNEDSVELVNLGDVLRLWLNHQMGCYALQAPVCYLLRGTKNHPKVDRKEDCRVYQTIESLLG